MTREDIIKMAREAGLYVGRNISGVQLVGSSYEEGGLLVHLAVEELERFAALVAAHEREECAKVCDDKVMTEREQKIIMFAVHRFMGDSYAQANAAAQDHDNRYFKPGAVDAFYKDAKDAEALVAKLKEKNT